MHDELGFLLKNFPNSTKLGNHSGKCFNRASMTLFFLAFSLVNNTVDLTVVCQFETP